MLISIDANDRRLQKVLSRPADEAVEELRQCITAFNASLESLARAYPGCIGIGAIIGGTASGALVLAPSVEASHFSPVAMNRAKLLAMIVADLPEELAGVFEIELRLAQERRQLQAQMQAALAAALAESETGSRIQ